MKKITAVRQLLKQRGTIEDTEVDVLLLSDNEIEIRVKYTYTPKKNKQGKLYGIFAKCRDIIYGEE